MPNTLKTSLLYNQPVVNPDTVVLEVVFPPSSAAQAYTAGGDYIDLTASKQLDPANEGTAGPGNLLPTDVEVEGQNLSGSQAEWIAGTTLANGKLKLYAAGGSEFSGNYAAPWVTGAVLLRVHLQPSDR